MQKAQILFFFNEPPTVDKVLQSVNNNVQDPKEVGFRVFNQCFLTDGDSIILWRHDYLKEHQEHHGVYLETFSEV